MSATKKKRGRPNNKGIGRIASTFKKRSENFAFKAFAARHFIQYGDTLTREKLFMNLNDKGWILIRKRLLEWKKDYPRLSTLAANPCTAYKLRIRPSGVGTVLSIDTEVQIVQWIMTLRGEGMPVSTSMVSMHALQIAMEQDISLKMFAASTCWVKGFLQRHKLTMRSKTRHGQVKPSDGLAMRDAFGEEVRQTMLAHGIKKVYNADQTGCFFEYLPRRTVNHVGASSVWVRSGGKEKERATAMLLADSEGTKYPLFLVFKTRPSNVHKVQMENQIDRHGWGKRNWRDVHRDEEDYGCQVYANAHAWWNTDLSVKFLDYHFGNRANPEEKVLLVWDAFSAHSSREVLMKAKELNIVLMTIPASYTWCCQPADVCWNKPLKDHLRRQWVDYLMNELKNYNGLTPFKFLPPSRSVVIRWISNAFNKLSESLIRHSFGATKWLGFYDGQYTEATATDDNALGFVIDELESHDLVTPIDVTFDDDVLYVEEL